MNILNLYEFEPLQKASNFIMANLLWILLSLPVITLPAATAGLFATFSPWVRGMHAAVFPDFFKGMRRHWLTSTLIAAIDLVIGGIVASDLLIMNSMDMPQLAVIISLSGILSVTLLTILVNMYIWPLMVTFDLSFRQLIKTAMTLAFKHAGWSVLIMGMTALIVGVSAFLPRLFLVLATFSSCALLMSWGAWRIARRYIEADELARLEFHGTKDTL
ncbi:MAG: DUF624 domain-containing protein [Anaerolineae bacterium]|nr:DUF624 domain-containing protein [Anaerolineae bacterium]